MQSTCSIPSGRVTIWNRGAERIKGWAEAEIIGRDFAIFYPADDIAAGKPAADLARAHRDGRIEEESWRVRKDGSEFLAHVTITALHDDAGALRGFGKVIRDITHEKAAEAAIVRREHHLRSILNTIPDAMIVMNENGIVASFSAAAELVFGYAASDVIGQNVAMLMPQVEARDHDAHLRKYRQTGERHVIGNVRLERAMRKGGETFPIELAVGEASIAGERIFTGFVRDLTNRHATERRVHELQSELVHVSRVSAMGTMASTLAHEINQPLTAIANYLEATRAMIEDSGRSAAGRYRRSARPSGGAIAEGGHDRPPTARVRRWRRYRVPRRTARPACRRGDQPGPARRARGRDHRRQYNRTKLGHGPRRPHPDPAGSGQPHPQRDPCDGLRRRSGRCRSPQHSER